MHVTAVNNVRRESFLCDYRRSIMYAFSFQSDFGDEIESSLCALDYKKIKDWVYEDKESELYIVSKSFMFIFRPGVLKRESRIAKVKNVVNSIIKKEADNKILSICVRSENRYVLAPFENNDLNQQKALSFFFKNIWDESGDKEPVIKDDNNNIIAYLQIKFEEKPDDVVCLDSAVYSGTSVMDGKKITSDFIGKIEKLGYKLWRYTVSDNVIKEMKNEKNK